MFLETLDVILRKVRDPLYLEDSFNKEDFEFNTFNLMQSYIREFPASKVGLFSEISENHTGFVMNDLDRYNKTERVSQILQNNKEYFALRKNYDNVYFMENGKIIFSSQTNTNEVEETITHTFFQNNSSIEFQYYFMEFLKTFSSDPNEFFPSKKEVERRRQQEPWVKRKSFFKTNFGYDEKNNHFLPGVNDEKIYFELNINQPDPEDEQKSTDKYVDAKLEKSFAKYEGVGMAHINFRLPILTYKELLETAMDGKISLDALKYYAGEQEVRVYNEYDSHTYFGLEKSFDRQKLSDVINSIQKRTSIISELYNDPLFMEQSEKLFKKLNVADPEKTFEESFNENKADVTILNFYLRYVKPFNTTDELKKNFFSTITNYLNCNFQLVDWFGMDFEQQWILGNKFRQECEYPILYDLRGELLGKTRYK